MSIPLLANPAQEALHFGRLTQRFETVELFRQRLVGEQGVNLTMTRAAQLDGLPAAVLLRREVVLCSFADVAFAQFTGRHYAEYYSISRSYAHIFTVSSEVSLLTRLMR